MKNEPFEDLLARLQGLLGRDIAVTLGIDDRFFEVGFSTRLERVETLPAGSAVVLYFANSATIDLAPSEQNWEAADWRCTWLTGWISS